MVIQTSKAGLNLLPNSGIGPALHFTPILGANAVKSDLEVKCAAYLHKMKILCLYLFSEHYVDCGKMFI